MQLLTIDLDPLSSVSLNTVGKWTHMQTNKLLIFGHRHVLNLENNSSVVLKSVIELDCRRWRPLVPFLNNRCLNAIKNSNSYQQIGKQIQAHRWKRQSAEKFSRNETRASDSVTRGIV
jgi:hypothetical protein